ncbi:MAG: HAD hydrolase-like protein [Deltaproteobacteria bacterium]|nr:HAD hydrolase-like protein [Deltaproteobacteria bacterium]
MLLHFDYDGVLVDSFDALLSAFRQTAVDTGLGRPPTRHDFETIEDLNATGVATLLGVSEDRIEDYTRRIHEVLGAGGYEPALFPGIPGLLRALSEEHTLVVVTSNYEHIVRHGLARNGVDACVSLVLDAGRPGTKSDKIRHALERFEVPPGEAFMIGDTRGDIHHGRAAGVRTAGVTWGYQARETLALESPDFIVDTPEELLELLGDGNQTPH